MPRTVRRVLVAHPAQQHSFRTAEGLAEAGLLAAYATTVYDRPQSLTGRLKRFLRAEDRTRVGTRSSPLLAPSTIRQRGEWLALFQLFVWRLPRSHRISTLVRDWSDRVFNKAVPDLIRSVDADSVILYDARSVEAFELLSEVAPDVLKILDVSAPPQEFVEHVLRALPSPEWWDATRFDVPEKRVSGEDFALADVLLVASEFSKLACIHIGVPANKIRICRYGVDTSFYHPQKFERDAAGPLRVLYVGAMSRRKGAPYLLDALGSLPENSWSATVAGLVDDPGQFSSRFPAMEFLGHVTKDRVRDEMQQADVLVFPSLADGFGLSVLEAMACGIPVICSRNAGVSDLVQDGVTGFIVDAGSSTAIADKLRLLIDRPTRGALMGAAAREYALSQGWDKYNDDLLRALRQVGGES